MHRFGGVSAVFNVEQNDYLSPTRPIHGVTVGFNSLLIKIGFKI